MSLYDHLMTWPPDRLAKELQRHALENAKLKRRILELEEAVFWMQVPKGADTNQKGEPHGHEK